jgi:hypothetical protein
MLAAPRISVCALAGRAKAPNTSNAALNVRLSFLIRPSSLKKIAGLAEETPSGKIHQFRAPVEALFAQILGDHDGGMTR